MKTIHVTYTIRIPYVPDFMETTQGEKVSIGDIQESGLRKIGEEWTNELVKKAKLVESKRGKDNEPYKRR